MGREFYYSVSTVGYVNAVEEKERIADLVNWQLLGEWETREAALTERFPKGLFDENGCGNYKISYGVVLERSDTEKQAELSARPAPEPTEKERLAALEKAVLAIVMKGV